MKYFRTSKWNGETCIHFFNRGWSIYSSFNKPNLLTELGIKPTKFVDKANALFEKYQIQIPNNFPNYSTIEHRIKGKKVDNFPIRDFLICIYCCIILDQNYKMDPSKILRSELIKPNSNRGIHHACSMATLSLNYLKKSERYAFPSKKRTN